MMKNTPELTGLALDWAVADCEGQIRNLLEPIEKPWLLKYNPSTEMDDIYSPSRDWAISGPIIEREGIAIAPKGIAFGDGWVACTAGNHNHAEGETPLIAALRCYVLSKHGAEVEVADELS